MCKITSGYFFSWKSFIARTGGEEFAIVLQGYRIEHAADKAQKALKRIREEVFINGGQELRFTMSMGVAQLGVSEDVSDWIKRADEALYQSKEGGRDQFTLAKFIKNSINVA